MPFVSLSSDWESNFLTMIVAFVIVRSQEGATSRKLQNGDASLQENQIDFCRCWLIDFLAVYF